MGVLDGKITIPKVGSVPKKVLIPVVGAAVGFIGYRYYKARTTAGTGADDTTASDFGATDAIVPDTLGAVPGDNLFGSGGTDTGDSTQTASDLTTNAAWSQYVAAQLAQSDTWSYTDIVTALGNYLNGDPLSTLQQAIVRAAIAIGGYPPVGTHTIVSGGDTALIVAPRAPTVTGVTKDGATLTTTAVAGAAQYAWHVSGVFHGYSTSPTSHPVLGLQPGTSYSASVSGVTASGARSPESPGTTFKTLASSATTGGSSSGGGGSSSGTGGVTLKTPAAPKVSKIARTAATLSTTAVPGATSYTWLVNNIAHGSSPGPTNHPVEGLHPSTTYRATVIARRSGSPSSKTSSATSFKTKA